MPPRKPLRLTPKRREILLRELKRAERHYATNPAGISRMATEGFRHSGTKNLYRIRRLRKAVESGKLSPQQLAEIRKVVSKKKRGLV